MRGDKAYSARICAPVGSPRSFQNPPAKPDTEHAAVLGAVDHPAFGPVDYQWRGIATRYDKFVTTYRAAIVLHTMINLRAHAARDHG